MLKFIIGPLLVGAGYAAGSYYGADAEQVVHKNRSATYLAIEQALDNMRTSGTTSFDGGTPVPYEIKIDRSQDEKFVVKLFFAGQQGAEADVTLLAQNDDKDTLIRTQIHAERAVLRTALAGTDKARLAYAPDWMLNLTFKPLLQQLATQIEQGQAARLEGFSAADAEAQWEANLSEEQRGEVAQWRQDEATAPAVDPNAAAKDHIDGKNN